MTQALLSLGSNVEPERYLRAAIAALRARFGVVVVSPVYRVPAVGFDGPDFLNAAAVIGSRFDADLLALLVDEPDVAPLIAAELAYYLR